MPFAFARPDENDATVAARALRPRRARAATVALLPLFALALASLDGAVIYAADLILKSFGVAP